MASARHVLVPLRMTMIEQLLTYASMLQAASGEHHLDDPHVDRLITYWLRICRLRVVA